MPKPLVKRKEQTEDALAIWILCCAFGCAKKTEPSNSEKESFASKPKEVARLFLVAFRAKDVDGVLQVSSTPFLIERDNPKSSKLIERTADLRTELTRSIDEWQNREEFPTEIVEVGEWGHSHLPREEVEKLNDPQDKVRDYGGYYVIPGFDVGSDKVRRAKVKVLLKDVDGKPRVVGLVSGDGATPY